MRLKRDWKILLKKAWSVRLIVIAGILSGAEIILPMYSENIPRGVFSVLVLIVTMAALMARIVAQKEFDDQGQ